MRMGRRCACRGLTCQAPSGPRIVRFEAVGPAGRGRRTRQTWARPFQRSILQPGSAFWSFFTPASVTRAPPRDRRTSRVNPLRCSSPASVTCVLCNDKPFSSVSLSRCLRPASVTSVPSRLKPNSSLKRLNIASPSSVIHVPLSSKSSRPVDRLRCSSPTSSDTCTVKVQETDLGQSLDMLDAGVRHLRVTEVQDRELSSGLRCSSPASVTRVFAKGQAVEMRKPFEIL